MTESQEVADGASVRAAGGRIELDVLAANRSLATTVVSFEHALKLQDDLGTALLESVPDSRWKCPKCGSTHVQVSLPTWYRETSGGTLVMVDPDGEANVQYWYCEECEESSSGEPDRA